MRRNLSIVGLAILLAAQTGCGGSDTTTAIPVVPTLVSPAVVVPCPVTPANGSKPPGEQASSSYIANGALWVNVWPGNTVLARPDDVGSDGSIYVKMGWWRAVRGSLTISGRRLDAAASPLQARVTEGYGEIGFQSTVLGFPTGGCWEVTGAVGTERLTFVTQVVHP